jgi:hypothetical protein
VVGKSARRGPHDYSFEHGLLGSLHELALWCCTAAIGVPVIAVSLAFLGGHQFFIVRDAGPPSRPLLALVLASFILVPMLALAGAICGLTVSLGLARTSDPGPVRAWRAAFLVAVAALALLVAGAYDLYFVPDLTV